MTWNLPDTIPSKPGEYRAALDTRDASPQARRYWNGQNWSNPYMVDWPENLKATAKAESSPFLVFWMN